MKLTLSLAVAIFAFGIVEPSHAAELTRSRSEAAVAAERSATRPRPETAGCFDLTLACGDQPLHNSLVASSCFNPFDGSYYDVYDFNGLAGETITVNLSTELDASLFLFSGINLLQSSLDSNTMTASLAVTGEYQVWVTSFGLGNYDVNMTCVGPSGGNCNSDNTVLCLDSGRFQVKATYDAGTSGKGSAQVVTLTNDTGYLWFFDSSNVETVVKIIDACALGGHYWFFAGGLTNVNTVFTVTDTQTGISKQYTNPANTKFQPIQDTAAFSTCP